MHPLLMIGAVLAVGVGVAHSVLGERYLLGPLFRRADLPRVRGSERFTKQILRFAWHLTTIAWWGFAALLLVLAAGGDAPRSLVGALVAVTFLMTAAVTAVASRGRHLAWPVFLAIAALTWLGTR